MFTRRRSLVLVASILWLASPAAMAAVQSVTELPGRVPIDPGEAATNHAYRIMLGRDPAPETLAIWAARLSPGGGYTVADLILFVWQSSEFRVPNQLDTCVPPPSDPDDCEKREVMLLEEILWKVHFDSLPAATQQEHFTALVPLDDATRIQLMLFDAQGAPHPKGGSRNLEFHCAALQNPVNVPEQTPAEAMALSRFVPGCTRATVTPPTNPSIDMRDYMVPSEGMILKNPTQPNGPRWSEWRSRPGQMKLVHRAIVDGDAAAGRLANVKFIGMELFDVDANPATPDVLIDQESFELYSWDANYVFLNEDHVNIKNTIHGPHGWVNGVGSRFRTRWASRSATVGSVSEMTPSVRNAALSSHAIGGRRRPWAWKWDAAQGELVCEDVANQPSLTIFPYRTIVEARIATNATVGEGGGLQTDSPEPEDDVVVLLYMPSPDAVSGPGSPQLERFYFARNRGWIKYENVKISINTATVPATSTYEVRDSVWFDHVVDVCSTPGQNPSDPASSCVSQHDDARYVETMMNEACVIDVPQCNNGIDDNENGLVDLADPKCTDASDRSEPACGLGFEGGFAAWLIERLRKRAMRSAAAG